MFQKWIQLPKFEATKLEKENKVPIGCGYQYEDNETKEMVVEYHVDTCEHFARQKNRETEYGGKLSTWFPSANNKPLIIFGHDKCTFKQYLLMKKTWIGPNGKNVMVPNNESQGIMLGVLQSHESSFGLELNPEELATVNNERKGQNTRMRMQQPRKRKHSKKRLK